MEKREYIVNGDFEKKASRWIYKKRSLNNGEFLECLTAEYMFGEGEHRKDSVAFDKGSDIEHDGIGYSVKSPNATLTELIKKADNSQESKQEVIKEFFNRVVSQYFIYSVLIGCELVTYTMSKSEFEKFLADCWKMDNPDGKTYKLRLRLAQSKTIAYLENMLATA